MQQIKLNLGCGHQTPDGWINVDYALGAWLAKIPFFPNINRTLKIFSSAWDQRIFICDLRKTFPWEDNSVDVIYSSHTLEHFSNKEGISFLRECFRVLRNGGLIRIVVPDLNVIVSRYIKGEVMADEFIETLGTNCKTHTGGFFRQKFAHLTGFPHKCMYDARSLLKIMKNLGFEVSTKKPLESEILDIQQIELIGRTKHSIIVEGRRP